MVTPNQEIKKMVYIYLVHYAEVEPEAALLAINTLKKELSNPNQLVRANALRTMSSIRVRLIAQLVGLAVKQASVDSSPYVRKAAAHAVPKLVSYVSPCAFSAHLPVYTISDSLCAFFMNSWLLFLFQHVL